MKGLRDSLLAHAASGLWFWLLCGWLALCLAFTSPDQELRDILRWARDTGSPRAWLSMFVAAVFSASLAGPLLLFAVLYERTQRGRP